MNTSRVPCAVLGATGAVGQTFVRLLADHPWLRLAEVSASERSAGRAYGDVVRWIEGTIPDEVAGMTVLPTAPASVTSPLVFSALDAAVAGEAEESFARAGRWVLSNARNFRMDDDVPLVIPEINADHLSMIDSQRANRGWSGAIVTNANCAAITIAMALAPLHRAARVEQLFVTTLQAVSGAGYPGVPSLDILGNVIPYIAGEEEKIETETRKLLGSVVGGRVRHADISISAQCTRVPVQHGHTACMALKLERRMDPEEAMELLRAWKGDTSGLALPSAADRPLVLREEVDRPQPRRDADAGRGMAVTVGRVRRDPILDLRLVAVGHNTVRGAAGATLLNAELLVSRGLLRV